MSKTAVPTESLKGSRQTWGIWERMIPSMLDERDHAGTRMLEIHLRRYRIAAESIANKRVLDIASGTGYGSEMLMRAGARSVTGVDRSSEAVAFAQENHITHGLKYVLSDACAYESDEPYDVIVSFETIEHLPDPQLFLSRMYQQLCNEGELFLSVPIGETRHIDPYHLHAFEQDEVIALLVGAGFQVQATRFDQWSASLSEILKWQWLYPESRIAPWTFLATWRGRRTLREVIFTSRIRLDMLMVRAKRTSTRQLARSILFFPTLEEAHRQTEP